MKEWIDGLSKLRHHFETSQPDQKRFRKADLPGRYSRHLFRTGRVARRVVNGLPSVNFIEPQPFQTVFFYKRLELVVW